MDTPVSGVLLNALMESDEVKQPTPKRKRPMKLGKGSDLKFPENISADGFFVVCDWSEETWYVKDKEELDECFIYQSDLEIIPCHDVDFAKSTVLLRNKQWHAGKVTRKTCYILDHSVLEKYEVYWDPSYPTTRYGKCKPSGMHVCLCEDRFDRDNKILGLDKKYSTTSKTAVETLLQTEMGNEAAIVISDGAYINKVYVHAHIYIDKNGVTKHAECGVPSHAELGSAIAEICGARAALSMCYKNRKKHVTLYYDNVSIPQVLQGGLMNDIPEVQSFKRLCGQMDENGYTLEFVEIHPKKAEHTQENKALFYLHSLCDSECRAMSDVFSRGYVNKLPARGSGKNYKQLRNKQRQ